MWWHICTYIFEANYHFGRFLDKAAIFPIPLTTKTGSSTLSLENAPNPWQVCTVTQVEEVKQVLRVMPIWLSNTFVGITYPALVTTYFTKQGRTMDRHMGPHFKIPPASLQGFITLFILILIPIYDRVFVPFSRWITGDERGITILKRMGVGTFFSIVACMVAACIEKKRWNVSYLLQQLVHDLNFAMSFPLYNWQTHHPICILY